MVENATRQIIIIMIIIINERGIDGNAGGGNKKGNASPVKQ